jgi:hypothetical protein
VILQHELAGEWGIAVERLRSGRIELLVTQAPVCEAEPIPPMTGRPDFLPGRRADLGGLSLPRPPAPSGRLRGLRGDSAVAPPPPRDAGAGSQDDQSLAESPPSRRLVLMAATHRLSRMTSMVLR